MYKTSYPGTNHSALPKDMVWLSHEPLWKEVAEARQEHRMQKFELDLAYTNDFGVNAKLRASIEESIEKLKLKLKLKLNLEGTFADFQNTIWRISGEFGDA